MLIQYLSYFRTFFYYHSVVTSLCTHIWCMFFGVLVSFL
jgi:hypothetical protein